MSSTPKELSLSSVMTLIGHLSHAIKSSNIAEIDRLVSEYGRNEDTQHLLNQNALLTAAAYGNIQTIDHLVSKYGLIFRI